jgi:hypothetical protein
MSTPAPVVQVAFSGKGDKKTITYSVQDRSGKTIVEKQAFTWKQPEEAATTLAYRIFDIGSKMPGAEKD